MFSVSLLPADGSCIFQFTSIEEINQPNFFGNGQNQQTTITKLLITCIA